MAYGLGQQNPPQKLKESIVDIHEYQAKELLANFGVAIPPGGVAYSAEQAVYRAAEIGGSRWAVKAQIHSGARGKAGGIATPKLASNSLAWYSCMSTVDPFDAFSLQPSAISGSVYAFG